MKTTFNKGDKVIMQNSQGIGGFIDGNTYIVIETDSNDDTVLLESDSGDEYWFDEEDVVPSSTSDEGYLSLAETLVGQVVTFNRKKFAIDNWCRLTSANLSKDIPKNVSDIITKVGYCFCVTSGEVILPASKVKKVDNRVVLNNEYTALISKDVVNVGCQKIPYDKVLEIVSAHKSLYGN